MTLWTNSYDRINDRRYDPTGHLIGFNDHEKDRRFDRWTNSSVDPIRIHML